MEIGSLLLGRVDQQIVEGEGRALLRCRGRRGLNRHAADYKGMRAEGWGMRVTLRPHPSSLIPLSPHNGIQNHQERLLLPGIRLVDHGDRLSDPKALVQLLG